MSYYLDLGPMITAISERPSEFDKRGRYLRHIPSNHRFRFDRQHRITIVQTRCACADLPIRPEQAQEMEAAVEQWELEYWRPLLAQRAADRRVREINRAFAAHFRRPSVWQRLWDGIRFFVRPRRYRFSLDHIDPDLPEDGDLVSGPSRPKQRVATPVNNSTAQG